MVYIKYVDIKLVITELVVILKHTLEGYAGNLSNLFTGRILRDYKRSSIKKMDEDIVHLGKKLLNYKDSLD